MTFCSLGLEIKVQVSFFLCASSSSFITCFYSIASCPVIASLNVSGMSCCAKLDSYLTGGRIVSLFLSFLIGVEYTSSCSELSFCSVSASDSLRELASCASTFSTSSSSCVSSCVKYIPLVVFVYATSVFLLFSLKMTSLDIVILFVCGSHKR